MVSRLLQKPVVAFKPSIDALNLIIGETGAELVITSPNDKAVSMVTQTKLREWGLCTTTFDRIPSATGKGHGILKWMAIAGEPESFVILDCENKEYGKMLKPYLVTVNPHAGGISEELAKKAIEVLKGRGNKWRMKTLK
jgi:hypothetical protein